MARRAHVVTWNGKDLPPELRELPAGRYVVEPVEDQAPALTPEEEAGIEAALESYRRGRVVDSKRARQIIDAALARPLNVKYTEEAIADIVEAISYLKERNPTAAGKLDAEISRCIEGLAANEFDGPVSRQNDEARRFLAGDIQAELAPANADLQAYSSAEILGRSHSCRSGNRTDSRTGRFPDVR